MADATKDVKLTPEQQKEKETYMEVSEDLRSRNELVLGLTKR